VTADRIEDLTEFREIADRARVDTDISDHLLTIFREGLAAKPKLIVELGVREGESTFVLERVARLTGATLVSVDLEDCSRVSPWERWHFVRSDDVAFAQRLPEWCRERGIEPVVDVLFVDTSHEYEHTRREIAAWLPRLAPKARVMFHDTNLTRPVRRRDGRVHPGFFEKRGVTQALEELLGVPFDEKQDFTLVRGEWTIRHDACCHGLTVLERGAAAPGAPEQPAASARGVATPRETRPAVVVFSERLDNESFCESIVRELGAFYNVRPCGPGWPVAGLDAVDRTGVRFYLELDAASGSFVRPEGLEGLSVPKFAWLIDTHKKPSFHREIGQGMDHTFYAHRIWGHVFATSASWLPLHADERIFYPVARERDLDAVFIGSQDWRADPLRRIAEKHGLRIHVSCTTGPREKSETAALYARAKLVFNRHCANDLNFRVFEAMAAGRVVLTDAQWNGQYDLLEDGKHYVLYKDERDLERQVLHYLQDDRARARIEAAAAALASREHTTRARVRQLVDAVEAILRAGGATALPAATVTAPRVVAAPKAPSADSTAGPATAVKRRWLFFVGDEPATVERKTYAERLAWGLARSGHEVVVARAQRGVLPRHPITSASQPLVLEIDPGPLPDALTIPNGILAASSALHAGIDRIAREHGPFDALVGEDALGGLVASTVAERLGHPFLLALAGCEVARRGNKLTREQLNVAELEHWFSDRALAVLAPTPDAAAAVATFYKNQRVRVVAPPWPRCRLPREAGRLSARLGLEPGAYIVVLSPHRGEREKAGLLGGDPSAALVLMTDDIRSRTTSGDTRLLSRAPAQGQALAALLLGAAGVVALDTEDPRMLEARALGCRVAHVGSNEAVANGVPFLVAGVRAPSPAPVAAAPVDDLSALEAVLRGVDTATKTRSSQKEAELALLH
jgi:hypothetical protein